MPRYFVIFLLMFNSPGFAQINITCQILTDPEKKIFYIGIDNPVEIKDPDGNILIDEVNSGPALNVNQLALIKKSNRDLRLK